MCPGTIALAATAVSAASSIAGGFAAASSAHYQAAVAANNATIARQNEQHAAGAASFNNERAGLAAAQQNSEVRASIAANNVDVNSGSPSDVQATQKLKGATDVAATAANNAQTVYGYGVQATNYQAQSSLDEQQVLPDIIGGFGKAAGTVAGAASQFPTGGGGGGDLSPVNITPENSAFTGGPMADAGIATGPPASLLSGNPSVPPQYQWMQDQQGVGNLY